MDRQLRVLILEHIPEDAESIQRAIERTGIDFVARLVRTRAEYQYYLEKEVDIVIADYDLPNDSAVIALQILRERKPGIPFIFVADNVSQGLAASCMQLGAADCIQKNRLSQLGSTVLRVLDRTPSSPPTPPKQMTPPPQSPVVPGNPEVIDITDTHLRLQKIFEDTINALASVTESRDPFTAGHQKRVASISYGIAYSIFQKRHEQAETIYLAGLIHDIGKVAVPIEILSKPTDLTDLEMNLMKTHPMVGYNILKKIDFPWPIADMVLQHHERLNGSGYPNQLKGKEIIMGARILGVADVVEAICFPRSYRSALTIEQAMEELSKKKETYYDPAVVDVCTSLFKRTEFSFTRSLELCDALRTSNAISDRILNI